MFASLSEIGTREFRLLDERILSGNFPTQYFYNVNGRNGDQFLLEGQNWVLDADRYMKISFNGDETTTHYRNYMQVQDKSDGASSHRTNWPTRESIVRFPHIAPYCCAFKVLIIVQESGIAWRTQTSGLYTGWQEVGGYFNQSPPLTHFHVFSSGTVNVSGKLRLYKGG